MVRCALPGLPAGTEAGQRERGQEDVSAPWGSQERQDPFGSRQGTGTRNSLLGTFGSKQRKICVPQTQEEPSA